MSRGGCTVLAALALGCFAPLLAQASEPAAPLRRLALLIGTNDGGTERVRLRYATSDAASVARVLTELGGVAPRDAVLLREGGALEVREALEALRAKLRAHQGRGRTEVLVYYSGHADEHGLLLGNERLAWDVLKREVDSLPADVRIAIIDACASGAFARTKGGVRRPSFLTDASTQVRGRAILTSSSADEVSQESDRIGGSYFTHHLVSGLRGAADASRDGRVTLGEAYQFAFHETLQRTERTQAGPQHPSWDIQLAGTGDVVMTDVRATSAGLQLPESLEGHFFVRDAVGTLVVEVEKASGRPTELGLAPGRYRVTRVAASRRWEAEVELAPERQTALAVDAFRSLAGEAVVTRGNRPPELDDHHDRLFNFSLFPWASTNDVVGMPVDNKVAIGLVASRSARLDGAAISAGANWTDGATRGLQLAGGINVSGGDLTGAQISPLGNWAQRSMTGGQASVLGNVAAADARWLQLAAGANFAGGSFEGLQLSVGANVAGAYATGVQTSVGANVVHGALNGVQLAVGANLSDQVRGLQFALVNVGGAVTGAQVGLINVAGHVRGSQVGLVNVADRVDGAPVGLFSFVRRGRAGLELFASDWAPASVAVHVGNAHVHSLLTLGAQLPQFSSRVFSLGGGLGVHLPFRQRWSLDVDASAHALLRYDQPIAAPGLLAQLRTTVAFRPSDGPLSFFVGPTLNLRPSLDGQPLEQLGLVTPLGSESFHWWPGLVAGLRL